MSNKNCVCSRLAQHCHLTRKYFVQLLADANESRSLGHFLDLFSSDIGAGRSEPAKYIKNSLVNVSSVRNLDSLALSSSIFRHTTLDNSGLVLAFLDLFQGVTRVLVHGGCRAHAVEQLLQLAVLLDDLTSRLIMTREHTTKHDKIGSGTDGLGNVSGTGAASILKMSIDNVTPQSIPSML